MEKLNLFHSMEVLFPEYFYTTESISMLWNWTKLWKLDFQPFPTIFSTYFNVMEDIFPV